MPYLFRRDNGVYYFVAKFRGKKQPVSLRTKNAKLARERYAEMADKYDRGLLDLKLRKRVPAFQELFDEYLPFCKAHRKPRTYRDAESHIRLFLSPVFGAMRAMDLEPKHVEDFVGQMLECVDPGTGQPDPYHPRTINLRLETLRKILNRAVENKVIPAMPCKIKMLPEPDSLPRYAHPAQIKDWMAYLDIAPRLRAILSLMTGITDRDLGYVMLDGYDPHNAMLRFRRPKTTTDIVVPLTPIGVQIMDVLVKDNPGPELFPAASSKRAFYEASKKATAAGGANITPHMLRHSFATWLISIGVPLKFIQQILGHKSIKTTERYARVMPGHLRAAMAKIEAKEFDIAALLTLPKKSDGRAEGGRWTEERKQAQSAAMKGNKRHQKPAKMKEGIKKRGIKGVSDEKRPFT